jgi:hypothetical protein
LRVGLRFRCKNLTSNQNVPVYDLTEIDNYLGHRDPKHTVHYTRVAGGHFEGL